MIDIIPTVRKAIAENHTREGILGDISDTLKCSRLVSKKLLFSFTYYAKEEILQEILDGIR